jgi:hypothetical protein
MMAVAGNGISLVYQTVPHQLPLALLRFSLTPTAYRTTALGWQLSPGSRISTAASLSASTGQKAVLSQD